MRDKLWHSLRGSFLNAPDFISALKALERPALAARDAARTKPVHKHKTRVRTKVKLLALAVSGMSERLRRVGRKHQKRSGFQRSLGYVTAGAAARIAVDFCRGLRADKASGARSKSQVKARLVASNQAAAETACEGPDASAPRPRRQEFEWTRGEGGSDGAFSGDLRDFEHGVPGRASVDVGRRDHGSRS